MNLSVYANVLYLIVHLFYNVFVILLGILSYSLLFNLPAY